MSNYDSMDELITVRDIAKKLGTSPRVRKFTLNTFLKQFEGKDLTAMVMDTERKADHEHKK